MPKENLQIFIKMSKLIFMWPVWKNGKIFKMCHHLFVAAATLNLSCILFCFYTSLFTNSQDLSDAATTVEFTTVISSGTFRYCYAFLRGPTFARLAKNIKDIFQHRSLNDEGPQYETRPQKDRAKKIALFYYVGSILFVIQLSFGPLVTSLVTSLPLPPVYEGVWVPVDVNIPMNRAWVYIQQCSASMLTGHLYLTMDAFFIYVLFITIDQLKLIRHSYENATIPNDSLLGSRQTCHDRSEDIMFKCYRHHRDIRRFIVDLEDLLAPIMLVDFLQSVPSITFLSLDVTISLKDNDWAKTLYLFEYLVVALIHMYCYHNLANELTLEELKLTGSMYAVPWYNSPKNTKTALLMSMAASSRPCRLTGGKLFRLSLEFFMQAMKTVFSFITVLFQMSGSDMA